MGRNDAGGACDEMVVEKCVAVNLEGVVHQSIVKFDVPSSLVCIAQAWPCWLPCILSFRLNIRDAYFPSRLHKFFPLASSIAERGDNWSSLDSLDKARLLYELPTNSVLLSSGNLEFFEAVVLPIASRSDSVPLIHVLELPFDDFKEARLGNYMRAKSKRVKHLGLEAVILRHDQFGGASNAPHLCIYNRLVPSSVFEPSKSVPRVLKHLINPASRGNYKSIPAPVRVQDAARRPILVDDLFRIEGLYDVFNPDRLIACPSVFSQTKWVKRKPTQKEFLRIFDSPVHHDKHVLPSNTPTPTVPRDLHYALSPLQVTSIFRRWWGFKMGDDRVQHDNESHAAASELEEIAAQPPSFVVPTATDSIYDGRNSSRPDTEISRVSSSTQAVVDSLDDDDSDADDLGDDDRSIGHGGVNTEPSLSTLVQVPVNSKDSSKADRDEARLEVSDVPAGVHVQPALPTAAVLGKIKTEHDQAKAVKSDDAQVPRHFWDELIFPAPVSEKLQSVLDGARRTLLKVYIRRLRRECINYMKKMHGDRWMSAPRRNKHGVLNELGLDRQRLVEVVYYATMSDWFEYPGGSALHFMRFPKKYRALARDGVPNFFSQPGPRVMKSQPKMKPDEIKVLREKLSKVIGKRYLDLPDGQLLSLIKYFAVPKGVVDGVAQDWRIVYHAGANGLNDCVWAPSFWLPTMDTMLRCLDFNSYMRDHDIGEMFLCFPLHPRARMFAGVDVGRLNLSSDETPGRWLGWKRNFMGYKPSPYNSVKTYRIAEEIIRGDRHDKSNPFRWDRVILNLPGTSSYNPNESWIYKCRVDGTKSSEVNTFVDDQRVSGSSPSDVRAAGHTLAARESYLGIQDAARKVRGFNGVKDPGAWAGGVVINDEEKGLVVLTSQDKWDKMKMIIDYWLEVLSTGTTELDHTKLRSDYGFLLYSCRPYPAMKPYLKGVGLSVNSWRPNRDEEGWKVKSPLPPTTTDEVVEDEYEDPILFKDGRALLPPSPSPKSGVTRAVPRLKSDLLALRDLTRSSTPLYRTVRAKNVITAVQAFGDASGGGFGSTIELSGGIQARFGLWGSDADDASSNYRELRNLVEAVEVEAKAGRLSNTEMWLYTDNSTAESCFYKGGSSSKLLHELILRLRIAEMDAGMTIYLVHVAGTRMIAQGTDGLSRGSLMEGVLAGNNMLDYIPIGQTAVCRRPELVKWVREWTGVPSLCPLEPEDWFEKAHGITGGDRDGNGVWIPTHAPNGRYYLWTPPPVIADAALEQALIATHKRSDAFHIFLIPRIFTPYWRRLFAKCCDFVFHLPVGHSLWPSDMHEPLLVGISLPFIRHKPWSLRSTPVLLGMGGKLRQVLASGEGTGRDILRELLSLPRRASCVSESMARGMLHLPRSGNVPHAENQGR